MAFFFGKVKIFPFSDKNHGLYKKNIYGGGKKLTETPRLDLKGHLKRSRIA